MPETADLELSPPPGFASAAEFRALLSAALEAREREAVGALEADGRGFLGAQRVLAQRPSSRPAPGEPRRTLNPRVAARDKWKRIEALGRLVAFLRSYRAAWTAMRRGARDVLFPAGTYWLRIAHGVPCAEFG